MVYESEFKEAVIVTADPAGAEAGLDVFRAGGNAIDAAAAAVMALSVALPASVGLCGYGGTLIVYDAKRRRVEVIDFDSFAPLAYRPEIFLDRPSAAKRGYLSVGVPGVVAGLDLAIKRYGTKSWGDLAQTAIRLAEDGIIVEKPVADCLAQWTRDADTASVRAIFPDGRIAETGERWKQPDLARLIRQLADDPMQFYRGEIARKIVRQVRANGGILSEEDFQRFRARVSRPLRVNYRGYDVYTPPPPAAGITTLSILKTLEQFELSSRERGSAVYFDHFIEAAKLCWSERVQYLGDPDFVTVPIEEMLSEDSAKRRAGQIRRGVTTAPAVSAPASEHTINVLAVDRAGNAASWTATQGGDFGSHVAIEGLGAFLGHTMSRFDLDRGGPNVPQPGKRVQHNMAPALVMKNDRLTSVIGMPGGTKIPTVTAQMAISLLDFGVTPGETVTAPRVHVELEEPVLLSPIFPEEVARELELMGHSVQRNQSVGGWANAVSIHHEARNLISACGRGVGGIAGV